MERLFTPIPGNQRIQTLDMLRGLAIFGILMVNMPLMNAPLVTILSDVKLWTDLPNQLTTGFIKLFFESKFYVLFSLLFGYGFWLFLNKTMPEGKTVIPVYRRRVFFLLLFGIAHMTLLWPGDILIFYALFGFLLLLFKKTPDRSLVKWALGFILVPITLNAIMVFFVFLAGFSPEAKSAMEAGFAENTQRLSAVVTKALEVYPSGSFSDIVKMRLTEYGMLLPGIVFFYPNVLAMFLLGQYAARKGYLNNPENHLPFFRQVFVRGLLIGLPLNIIYTTIYSMGQMNQPSIYTLIATICSGFGGPALTMAYVSGIVLLISKDHLKSFSAKLAPVGRMALTNYLMHSIIASVLYLSYGFALYGKVNIWQGILITIAIFAVQIPLSNLWLKHFRFGPFEWLWRSLTYLQWQPMRK
ncbi:MAG: DUF418 domain-containing protein [Bacteroidales bacterium]|nr:DUF418 domain-containing protein [Bacteroidales bacterium]